MPRNPGNASHPVEGSGTDEIEMAMPLAELT
jgi:hypothetical protein